MADDRTYAAMDLSCPALTNRTWLYHQRPLGVGTLMVESLTGYIIRLANAHVVSPGALIFKGLGRRVGTSRSGRDGSGRCYPSFAYDAYTLNGMTDRTEKWALAVAGATGVESVRFLTMLPWKQVFSARGITRTKRAWCGRCYQEWQAGGLEIYEPLLWTLAAVSVCLLHQQQLTTVCPRCGREPHVVSCRSLPGHCSRCGEWLGGENGRQASGNGTADIHDAQAIAEMLAKAPTLKRPVSAEVLNINLQACLDDLADGNTNLFERVVGMGQNTVAQWLCGRLLPTLGSLLKIRRRLGIPLLRFLTEPITSGDADWEHARDVVGQYQGPQARSRKVPAVRAALEKALRAEEPRPLSDIAVSLGFKHPKSLRAYDPETCRAISERYNAMQIVRGRPDAADPIPCKSAERALKTALMEVPPPSARDVSLRLGLRDTSWLIGHFPKLCRALAQRSKKYRRKRRVQVEKALRAALTEEPPPTVKEVAKRLGYSSSSMLWLWFPDLQHAVSARASLRRDRRLARIRSVLEVAASEEPPPSGMSIAARARVSESHIRKLFPEFWCKIVTRHSTYKSREAAKNRQEFQEEVRKIARDLFSIGSFPSRRRVQALIGESKLKGSHLIVREVRRVVSEISGNAIPTASYQQSS